MENKSLDQLGVETWLDENPEAREAVDEEFAIPRLRESVERWRKDLADLNDELFYSVNTFADNVLSVGGNKTKVLVLIADYNQYLFEYTHRVELVQDALLKDQRALWIAERKENGSD